MSLRALKARPKPNLESTSRRRNVNEERNDVNIASDQKAEGISNEVADNATITSSIPGKTGENKIEEDTKDSNVEIPPPAVNSNISMRILKARPKPNVDSIIRNKKITVEKKDDITDKDQNNQQIPNIDATGTDKTINLSEPNKEKNSAKEIESSDLGIVPPVNNNNSLKLKARPKPKLGPTIRSKSTVLRKEPEDIIIISQPEEKNQSVNSEVKNQKKFEDTCSTISANINKSDDKVTNNNNEHGNEPSKFKARPKPNLSTKRRKPLVSTDNKVKDITISNDQSDGINDISENSENITTRCSRPSQGNCTKKPIESSTAFDALKEMTVDSVSASKEISKTKLNEPEIVHNEKIECFENVQNNKNISLESDTNQQTPISANIIKSNEETNETKTGISSDSSVPNKKAEIQKLRVKIHPRIILKTPGVETLKVKIVKDDESGTSGKADQNHSSKTGYDITNKKIIKPEVITLNNEIDDTVSNISDDGLHLSFEIDSSDENSVSSRSSKCLNENSPSHRVRSRNIKNNPMAYSRLFNLVKPNLSTANRSYRLQHSSTSYGKLNSEAKQRFRDKFGNQPPDHSKLTMLDLIFYNPRKNPMSREKEVNKETILDQEVTTTEDNNTSQTVEEDKTVNDDAPNVTTSDSEMSEETTNSESSRAVDNNGLPVPQLKITPDGKVIIAPESLIVAGRNDVTKTESRPLIVENDLTHHKFVHSKPKTDKRNWWSFQETLKFYRALYATGSDFTSMAHHFPDRTRNCLKRKFKREEKINGHLIDRVLGSRRNIDFSDVEKELALSTMWDQIEKSGKRKSEFLPDIPNISEGITGDMFLSRKEKKLAGKRKLACDASKPNKTSQESERSDKISLLQEKTDLSERENDVVIGDVADNQSNISASAKIKTSNIKLNKVIKKKRRKRNVLKLKGYLLNKDDSSVSLLNSKKYQQKRLKCLDEQEMSSSSSSEEEVVLTEEQSKHSPIVVNTSIESSGIKYTKSVTFNPGNMDNPLDINETIAHCNDQEFRTSSYIIDEIVNILSNDESPSIENLVNNDGNDLDSSNNSSKTNGDTVNNIKNAIDIPTNNSVPIQDKIND